MTDEQLLATIDQLRNTMVSVATGHTMIVDANVQFQRTYATVAAALGQRRIENPLPYGDLWDWYGRW